MLGDLPHRVSGPRSGCTAAGKSGALNQHAQDVQVCTQHKSRFSIHEKRNPSEPISAFHCPSYTAAPIRHLRGASSSAAYRPPAPATPTTTGRLPRAQKPQGQAGIGHLFVLFPNLFAALCEFDISPDDRLFILAAGLSPTAELSAARRPPASAPRQRPPRPSPLRSLRQTPPPFRPPTHCPPWFENVLRARVSTVRSDRFFKCRRFLAHLRPPPPPSSGAPGTRTAPAHPARHPPSPAKQTRVQIRHPIQSRLSRDFD